MERDYQKKDFSEQTREESGNKKDVNVIKVLVGTVNVKKFTCNKLVTFQGGVIYSKSSALFQVSEIWTWF